MAKCPKCVGPVIRDRLSKRKSCRRCGTIHRGNEPMSEKPKSKRGFAAMHPDLRRKIAAKGGAAIKPEKRSFYKDRDLAAEAGRKGGRSNRGMRRPTEA